LAGNTWAASTTYSSTACAVSGTSNLGPCAITAGSNYWFAQTSGASGTLIPAMLAATNVYPPLQLGNAVYDTTTAPGEMLFQAPADTKIYSMCEPITATASMAIEAQVVGAPRILGTTASDGYGGIMMIDTLLNPIASGAGNFAIEYTTGTTASGPASGFGWDANNGGGSLSSFQWGASSSVVTPMTPFNYSALSVYNSTQIFGWVGTAVNKPQWSRPTTVNTITINATPHYLCLIFINSLATAPGNNVARVSWVRVRTGTSELQ
jgi:hypothetical protein